LDAVCAAVAELEDVDQFNSGRGAALDSDGRAELDACVMTGDRRAGAVCGTRFARHPVIAARRVMEATPHVLLAGPSRETLEELGVECVDPSYFVTELRREQLRRTCAGEEEFAKHGTVGAVAIDSAGHIAVATSTGGIVGQMAGRVGDSPLVGAGTYADERSVAVSCTGYGEMFVRAVTAHSLHARILIGGESLEHAARAVLDDVAALGGDGGLISATPDGTGVIAYNSPQMFYAYERGNEQVVHV
jgi:beta-aspartyl-peptidase (threonine type)